ncbi:glycosyltransferase [Maribacter aquivivus]|uniref:glycosyltransferase n=1 Tax=Maribacter aquivivus TaxID=228958 RepID=UPI002492F1FF|nr:glycosyltransferase [Maribacter aquivivus]
MEKLKLLISAYACGPNVGSEPGVGWNFVTFLALEHEVHVIVEKRKWEQPINEFLNKNSHLKENLKFYFIEKKRNKKLRKLWPPSYYYFYRIWQRKALKLALKLESIENFDVVHQLTMVGYREPGYLWKINKPFVWGPIGGLVNSPWSFLPSLGLKGLLFFSSRNIINYVQRNFSQRPKKAARHINSKLISATPGDKELINQLWNRDSFLMPEIGHYQQKNFSLKIRNEGEPLKIVWSGLHIPRKNLSLLLLAAGELNIPFELHILGKGEMTKKWQDLALKLGVEKQCVWHGWVDNKMAINLMKNTHVLCITSISDLTSTITLEGLSYGLPIICLDHCGFSNVVTDKCGIKIPVDNPKNAASNFTRALTQFYDNEMYRQKLSEGALLRSKDFIWEQKVIDLNKIYNELLKNVKHV